MGGVVRLEAGAVGRGGVGVAVAMEVSLAVGVGLVRRVAKLLCLFSLTFGKR